MSKIGQHVQQLQEGQPETMEPDPLYDEREVDPGYDEFNLKLAESFIKERKVKW
jgi:hypothetical protein